MSIDAIIAGLPDKTAEERQRMRRNAERNAADGNPRQKDALRLLAALDAYEKDAARDAAAALEAERDATRDRTPEQRVMHAFTVMPPSETDLKVIQVLLDNPGATSATLSGRLGWGGQIWHTHFGKMCQAREVYLWPARTREKDDSKFWCGILAHLDRETAGWTMKPDAVAGLSQLGIVARADA